MKAFKIYDVRFKICTNLKYGVKAFIPLFISIFILMEGMAMGQDKTETKAKMSVSMSLGYKISDGKRQLKVKLSRKENRKKITVDNATVPVSIYYSKGKEYNPTTGEGLIGKVTIDDDGEGVFEFPDNFNSLTAKAHEFKFLAKFDSDSMYEDDDEDITVSDAKIAIEYKGKDSVKSATAILTEWKDSAYKPVSGVEMKLSIKRDFGSFTFSEEGATTDSTGKVSGNLPLDIPGNADSTITILASVIDNDNYGTVESSKTVTWNILPKRDEKMGRTLWANQKNAPISLVIISCSIIGAIWGTLIYLVFQLFKIKKIGKQDAKIETAKITS